MITIFCPHHKKSLKETLKLVVVVKTLVCCQQAYLVFRHQNSFPFLSFMTSESKEPISKHFEHIYWWLINNYILKTPLNYIYIYLIPFWSAFPQTLLFQPLLKGWYLQSNEILLNLGVQRPWNSGLTAQGSIFISAVHTTTTMSDLWKGNHERKKEKKKKKPRWNSNLVLIWVLEPCLSLEFFFKKI